jgi:hypothetical protein
VEQDDSVILTKTQVMRAVELAREREKHADSNGEA